MIKFYLKIFLLSVLILCSDVSVSQTAKLEFGKDFDSFGNLKKEKTKPPFIVENQRIIYDYKSFIKHPADISLLPSLKKGIKRDLIKNSNVWILSKIKFNDSLIGCIVPFVVHDNDNSLSFIEGNLVYSSFNITDDSQIFLKTGQYGNMFYYKVNKPEIIILSNILLTNNNPYPLFRITELNYKMHYFKAQNGALENYFSIGSAFVLFSFGILYLFIFLFHRKDKYNFYFSLFCLLISVAILYNIIVRDYYKNHFLEDFIMCFFVLSIETFLLLFLSDFIVGRFRKFGKIIFIIISSISIITLLLSLIKYDKYEVGVFQYSLLSTVFIGIFESIRIIIVGLIKKKKEAKLVSVGLLLSFAVFVYIIIHNLFSNSIIMDGDFDNGTIFMSLSGIVFPVFMGVSLASDFALKSKKLQEQILTIQNLSIENLNKEKEKQEIILKQKENLEIQVFERTKEVVEQKHLIEEKQKEIIDSINYAKRIQTALLASDRLLQDNLSDFFVLFKPKDIVAGDFYWGTLTDEGFVLVTADCTGHGVPGAFMSLLNISKLSEVINQKNILRTDLIFNDVRNEIIKALNPEGSIQESKDGMDAVICKFNFNALKLQFSAANNSFYIIRNNEILHCKADKMPVGKGHDENANSFTYNEIGLQKGDMIYTFTDGYADQFGGPKGKKFKYKQLEDKLLEITSLPLSQQKEQLNTCFENWKGDLEQVDDVLIIGIRV